VTLSELRRRMTLDGIADSETRCAAVVCMFCLCAVAGMIAASLLASWLLGGGQ